MDKRWKWFWQLIGPRSRWTARYSAACIWNGRCVNFWVQANVSTLWVSILESRSTYRVDSIHWIQTPVCRAMVDVYPVGTSYKLKFWCIGMLHMRNCEGTSGQKCWPRTQLVMSIDPRSLRPPNEQFGCPAKWQSSFIQNAFDRTFLDSFKKMKNWPKINISLFQFASTF